MSVQCMFDVAHNLGWVNTNRLVLYVMLCASTGNIEY